MKIIRAFQYLDLILQSLLLLGVSFPLLFSIGNSGFLIWSLMFLFLLGVWQLFSALVLGFGLQDKFRHLYLLTAVAFCGLFFSAGFFFDQFPDVLNFIDLSDVDIIKYGFIAIMIVSYAAGIYYFSYSSRYSRNRENSTHQ